LTRMSVLISRSRRSWNRENTCLSTSLNTTRLRRGRVPRLRQRS
jgi:hypothetical protein